MKTISGRTLGIFPLALFTLLAGCDLHATTPAPATEAAKPAKVAESWPEKPHGGRVIKVGIIRCDSHGMYYGPLMGRHDPLKLRDPLAGLGTQTRYSWMGGGSHFAFYQQYNNPTQMTVGHAPGFEVVKVWDEFPDAAAAAAGVFLKRPEVCKTFEEVSDGVDMVLVANCDFDGSDHLKLAAPGLKKGVPTFVDKPFASTYADAKALVEMARDHGAPLMSLSMLRVEPAVVQFKSRVGEIGEPQFGAIRGGWNSLAGQIHSIALAQHVFGAGVEAVESMGEYPMAYLHLDYGSKVGKPRDGVMIMNRSGDWGWHSGFFAQLYNGKGMVCSGKFAEDEHPAAALEVLKLCREMVETGKSPVAAEEMLEQLAIVEAGRRAHAEKRKVTLQEIQNPQPDVAAATQAVPAQSPKLPVKEAGKPAESLERLNPPRVQNGRG
jgi:predicted dehydrogenase